MKREYTDPKKDNNAAMFSNQLHRHLLQPYSTSSSSPPPIHFHPFPFPVISRDVDDETSSGGGGGNAPITPNNNNNPTHSSQQPDPKHHHHHNNSNDGATIEVQRRPRGRPPGSKNKPKPPVIITRELPDPIMSPYILEISNSSDVIDSVAKFARRRNTGLCILHASGAVANVTIRQPTPNSASTVTFHGRFDILSLDATFLTPSACSQIVPNTNLTVAVSLSIPQGQIIGGIVAGPLVAAGTVYVIAASFSNPSFQRLPIEQEYETDANNNNNRTASSGGNEQQSGSGGASGDNNNGGGGGGMYGCGNMGASDVIWAPTPRQPF